jgi:hypothetical protein
MIILLRIFEPVRFAVLKWRQRIWHELNSLPPSMEWVAWARPCISGVPNLGPSRISDLPCWRRLNDSFTAILWHTSMSSTHSSSIWIASVSSRLQERKWMTTLCSRSNLDAPPDGRNLHIEFMNGVWSGLHKNGRGQKSRPVPICIYHSILWPINLDKLLLIIHSFAWRSCRWTTDNMMCTLDHPSVLALIRKYAIVERLIIFLVTMAVSIKLFWTRGLWPTEIVSLDPLTITFMILRIFDAPSRSLRKITCRSESQPRFARQLSFDGELSELW